MEDVVAAFIPIVAITGFFAWLIAISPVGRAYSERIRGATRQPERADQDAALQAVEELRREVAELAERVDFAERLLAKPRADERLAPPR